MTRRLGWGYSPIFHLGPFDGIVARSGGVLSCSSVVQTQNRCGMVPVKEQFSGCLVGHCLGDALAAPWVGQSPKDCAGYVAEQLTDSFFTGGGDAAMPLVYSANARLTRELLLSLRTHQRWVASDYVSRMVALLKAEQLPSCGRATHDSIARLAQGTPWSEAGMPSPSASCGSALRAAPLGLFFRDDPQAMIKAAREQSLMTHQDVRCAAGAVAIAGAVSLLLSQKTRPLAIEPFLAQLSEWVGTVDQTVAFDIYQLSAWVKLSPDAAALFLVKAGLCPGYRPEPSAADHSEWSGISSYVVASVLWTLYSFLRSPTDFRQALGTAISVGGEVGGVAAMVGALAGAYLGRSALPTPLIQRLSDGGSWSGPALIELAEACAVPPAVD